MKWTVFCFLLGVALAAAIPKPDFSVGLNLDGDTNAGYLGGVVPRVSWDTDEVSVAGFDVQGGIDSIFTDLRQPPQTNVWGEAKRFFPNSASAIALRGDINADTCDTVNLNLRVNGLRNPTALQFVGAANLRSSSIAVNAALGSTTINRPFGMPGTISLNPRYDIQGGVPDATIGYSYEKTSLNVDAQSQRLTLSHIFGKDNSNQIVPSLSTKSKDFCVSYSRNLPAGRVTTTWKPDDSIALQFSDGGWDATIRAPLEGNFLKAGSGFKLSVKRNVGISLF